MELKRILAKDARSANEKAAALYGGDVMVISCNKVGNQTELIVAVDSAPAAPAPMTETAQPEAVVQTTPAEPEHPFAQVFERAKHPPEPASQAPKLEHASPSSAALPAPLSLTTSAQTPAKSPEDAQERLRGQELVSLVRDEIASLRREFHLSRLGSEPAGATSQGAPVRLLHEALIECQAPVALRATLVDGLLDCADTAQALKAVEDRLHSIVEVRSPVDLLSGTHALCGPSGAGKTLMAHRILMAAMREVPIEAMALISCADHKPGAWSQMQILAAQTGVEVFRARDLHALGLLLEDLDSRQLIVIDTAGSDPLRQAQELAQLNLRMSLHAVMPAQASSDQLRRLHSVADLTWQSLMVSKLDEQPNPWPLLGFLSVSPLPVSALAGSERAQDGLSPNGLDELVRWAVDKLQNTLEQTAVAGMVMPAMLPRSAPKAPARTSKPRVSRAAKSTPTAAQPVVPVTCLQ